MLEIPALAPEKLLSDICQRCGRAVVGINDIRGFRSPGNCWICCLQCIAGLLLLSTP